MPISAEDEQFASGGAIAAAAAAGVSLSRSAYTALFGPSPALTLSVGLAILSALGAGGATYANTNSVRNAALGTPEE
jgi:hypothetical protein